MLTGKRVSAGLLSVVLAVLAGIAVHHWLSGTPLGTDSAVYRAGALAVWHGQPLYEPLLALDPKSALELPFTYPPAAALLFLPLAALPVPLVWLLLAAGSVLALWSVLRRFAGTTPLVVLCVLPFLEPVWRLLSLGQINAVLMVMVVADVLPARSRRYGGVLVGLAAAVKLTPLIFIAHLFLAGRRAEGWRALATFFGASAVGALVLPGDSWRYWSSAVVDNRNAGSIDWVLDQSLHGLLVRLGVTSIAWYAALAALCLAVAAILVRDFHRRGDPRAALLVSAGCALLVSPLSWTHHWIWVVALAGYLVSRVASLFDAGTDPQTRDTRVPQGRAAAGAPALVDGGFWTLSGPNPPSTLAATSQPEDSRAAGPLSTNLRRATLVGRWAALAGVVAVFTGRTLAAVPEGAHRELAWDPFQAVLGNAYVLVALAAGVVLTVRLRLRPATRSELPAAAGTPGSGSCPVR